MYQLVYVSSAVNLFSDSELEGLLDKSRRNNGKDRITGLLLYLDGNFIQVLEGERELVQTTHMRIAQDTRHRGLITLLQGESEKRDFNEWSMGFKKVEKAEGEQVPGYSDFLKKRLGPDEHKSAALRLLEHFRKINA